jgi:predicted dehydrogenase
MPRVSRRRFQAAIATAALSAASASRVFGANERVRVGFIGVGNRGDRVLDGFLAQPDVQVVAIADLHAPYLDFAAKKIGGAPARYADYRKLLDHDGLDAVVISTPDHWHALQMIQACRAGKDVYVEKPLSLCVAEGRRMAEAQRKHGGIVQVGIQALSSPLVAEVAALVQEGAIGTVTAVRAFHVVNEWPKGIGSPPDEDPPPDLDWDAWQGPAPLRKFNRNRGFYRFRWFYDYSGGQLTNFGTHRMAVIHRVLGVQAPESVVAIGGKFADYDNREVPDTLGVAWKYPGDTLVTFSQFNASGAPGAARPCDVEFRGTKGTLYVGGKSWELVPEVISPDEVPLLTPFDRGTDKARRGEAKPLVEARRGTGTNADDDHVRNFVDCVKSRAQPNCGIEFGHRATSSCLLAGIALRTRTFLDWDASRERFTNSERANGMLDYRYRKPYDGELVAASGS